MNAKQNLLSSLLSNVGSTLGRAVLVLALWGIPAAAAQAQILSCQGYRDLSSEQRQYYTLGFVEGISFTHLDLRARAEAAAKNTAADKDKKQEDRVLVLQVMEGVAGNIELAVPHNLTVGQVMDKLLEICAQDSLRESPFLDAYYQYFQALLAAESVRRAQAQQAAAAAKAQGTAAPRQGEPKKEGARQPASAAKPADPKPAASKPDAGKAEEPKKPEGVKP